MVLRDGCYKERTLTVHHVHFYLSPGDFGNRTSRTENKMLDTSRLSCTDNDPAQVYFRWPSRVIKSLRLSSVNDQILCSFKYQRSNLTGSSEFVLTKAAQLPLNAWINSSFLKPSA